MHHRFGIDLKSIEAAGQGLGAASLALLIVLLPVAGAAPTMLGVACSLGLIASLVLLAISGRFERGSGWFAIASIAFLVSAVLSIWQARMPEASWERSLGLPMAVVTGLVSVRLGTSPKAWRTVAFASIAAVLAISLDLAWQRWSGTSLFTAIPFEPRQQASLPNPNDVGMVVPLSMLGVGAIDLSRRWGRVAAVAILLAVTWCYLASESRNILIGVAAGGLVVVGLATASLGRPTRVVAIVLLLALPLILPLASERQRVWADEVIRQAEAMKRAESARGDTDLGVSSGLPLAQSFARTVEASPRWRLAIVGWRTFRSHPWLGCGPGLFAEAWWHEEGGVAWGEVAPRVGYMPWAHNLAVEAGAERGAIGVLASLAIVGLPLAFGAIALRRGTLEVARRDRLAGAMAAVLAIVAMGLFDLTLLKDWVSMLLFASLGLLAGAAQPASTQASETQGQQ